MASIDSKTSLKIDELVDGTVISGRVENEQLLLTTRGGAEIVAGTVSGTPGPAGDPPNGLYNPSALAPWFAALANRDKASASMCCIGDSITEGAKSTVLSNRWQRLLQDSLRKTFPLSDAQGDGWMPATTIDPVPQDARLTFTDPNHGRTYSGPGLGMKCRSVDNTHTVSWSGVATRIKVWWSKGPLAGNGTITLDSVPNSITGVANSTVESGNFWDSGTLSRAIHTLSITGTSGFGFPVDAIEVFAGDYDKGVHIYDAGHYMAQASWFCPGQGFGPDTGHWLEYGVIKPVLTTVMFGVNDWSSNVTPATFLANIDIILDQINTKQAGSSYGVLLMIPYKIPRDSQYDAAWNSYVAGLKARAVGKVAVFDLNKHWPALVANMGLESGIMYEDGVPTHPNDVGEVLFTQFMLEILSSGNAAMLQPPLDAVPLSTIQAKGDLIAGSAAGAVVRLPNPNVAGKWLQSDPTQASGFSYADAPGSAGSIGTYIFSTPQAYTSWTIPAGAKELTITGFGGGGGGASGRRGQTGTARCGGGGGAAGAWSSVKIPTSSLPGGTTTLYIKVGGGGTAGQPRTTNDTSGQGGGGGGSSAVALVSSPSANNDYLLYCPGGNGALGGGNGTGGLGGFSVQGMVTSAAGVQSSAAGSQPAAGNTGGMGAGGGGGGGGVSTSEVYGAGGTGGAVGGRGPNQPAGGATDGSNGTNGSSTYNAGATVQPGAGGGGGAGSVAGVGGTGGNGGRGAGGGGGGGSTNGNNSGAGGVGGDGVVLIEVTF